MPVEMIRIAPGAQGCFIKNDRFNTTLISYNFYLPLDAENMAANALLPYMLTSCSAEYRDYIDLNIKLLGLYGADLACSVSKCGDCLHVRLSIGVINNEYSFDDCKPVNEAAELMAGLIFDPAAEDGCFIDSDLSREKRKTIERIQGEINDKKSYARTRLFEEMFGSDPYGKFIYGTAEEVEAIDGKRLYTAWQQLLQSAFIRVNVVGRELPDGIFDSISQRLKEISRVNITDVTACRVLPEKNTPTYVTQRFDVTQGKLVMGFTAGVYGSLAKTAPMALLADIFGGGPYSKLFTNVREKESLCYYCSATYRRGKGFMTVDSGIEGANADKVVTAVLKELEDIRQGNFTNDLVSASKKAISDALLGYYDSPHALNAWFSRELNDNLSPEEAVKIISSVTREDIIEAAKGVRLHTVYRLLPLEGEE